MTYMQKFRVGAALASAILSAASFLLPAIPALASTPAVGPYTVNKGDTVYRLAALSGFGLLNFLRVNHLHHAIPLVTGERVAMPFLYRVEQGDKISYIARRYDTTVGEMSALNHLSSAALHPGQVLLIGLGSVGATIERKLRIKLGSPLTFAASPPPLAMIATAYDASVASNGHWGPVDYFGDPLEFGDVAVDPSVIPLGTRLYISGYSDPELPKGGFYATAVDIGGKIKGHRIDIFLPTPAAADTFGMESVQVAVGN